MDIIRLHCWRFHVDLYFEEKINIIQRMESIGYILRLTCVSWLPHLRSSGSEIFCDQGYKLGLSVGMVLRASVGYLLRYYINVLLGLEL